MKKSPLPELAAPSRFAIVREARAVYDLASMVAPLVAARLRRPVERHASQNIPVPGFGGDDRSTAPLRHYLKRRGFQVEGWSLGRNLGGLDLPHTFQDLAEKWNFEAREDYNGEGSVPLLCDQLIDRVTARSEHFGGPITLIGWSLGGYLAREAARDLPDYVDRVITLGSPVIGGPKYTAAAPAFRSRGMDLDWIESEVERREACPIRQPITAIISKSDAIVGWTAAIDRFSTNVRHVEVDAAHLGMGFNPAIWKLIVADLEGVEATI